MRVESGGRTEMNGVPITSGAGAMGLMQVMPATYDELQGRYGLGSPTLTTRITASWPARPISASSTTCMARPASWRPIMAALAGSDDYLTRNRPLPDETRRYVAKIGPYITDTFPNRRSTAETYAMNSLPTSIPAGPRYTAPPDTATAAYVPPAPVASAPPAAGRGRLRPAVRPGRGVRPAHGLDAEERCRVREAAAYVPPPASAPPVRSHGPTRGGAAAHCRTVRRPFRHGRR